MDHHDERKSRREESEKRVGYIYIFLILIETVGESKMRIAPTTYLGSVPSDNEVFC